MAESTASMKPKYLYGVVQMDAGNSLKVRGLGGASVHIISDHGLGCVLSDYSGRNFAALSKEEVVRCLLAHQVVVEQAMKRHTILPVKFGTLLEGEAQAHALLSQGRHQLLQALSQFRDRVEVEVAATWDTDRVIGELAGQEDIVRLRSAIKDMPPAKALQQRVRLGQLVKMDLDHRRVSCGQRILAALQPLALDVQPNALLTDEMVMNVAFLLYKDRQGEFDSRVKQLNDSFQDQLDFRVIGPLPPYSFATVEVAKPHWEEIDGARQILGLGACLSVPQVREAYRRLAAQAHPDLNPGQGAAAGERLAKLREASEVLLTYCRGRAAPEDAVGTCSISRETVEQALFIHIKRPASQEVGQGCFGETVSPATWQRTYATTG